MRSPTQKEVELLKKLKFAREGYLILSTVFCVAGLIYPCMPRLPALWLYVAAGVLLIAYGLVRIVGYYADDLYCLAFQYGLACGLLLIILGVIVLALRERVGAYLLPGLGLLILIDGLLTIQTAGEAKRFGLNSWKLLLAVGLVAGALGAVTLARYFAQGRGTPPLVSAALLAEGIMNQCVIFSTVKERRGPPGQDTEEDSLP